MTERELKRVRPHLEWDSSAEAYFERFDACEPFLTTAYYRLSRWRGLVAVSFSHEWAVATQSEVETMVPGFLYGCRSLWGLPDGVEVFTSPKWSGGEPQTIAMSWSPTWAEIYAMYRSPVALFPIGEKYLAGFHIVFAVKGEQIEPRHRKNRNTEPEVVASYFSGVPDDTQPPKLTFH